MRSLFRWLVPHLALGDVLPMLGVALLGAMLAGVYGVVHDQITFAISPEYFTRLKFRQFRYADLGLGELAHVAAIGFLATWWVGLVIAWLLGRRFLPGQPRGAAYRRIGKGFACVFCCALAFGLLGYGYGLWRGPAADYSGWAWAIERFRVEDTWSFVRVAYIHNAGYLGGLVGLIAALVLIRREPAVEGNGRR